MECPDALRNYVGQRLEQSLHLASIGTNRLSFCLDSFLTELILLGLEHNHEPKDYRRWIAQCGEIISKCVLQYPDVGDRVRSNEMKPLDVLNFWNEMKERNEKVFQDITSHHQLLIYHGWDYLSFTETTTKLYSIAASEMGKRPWVRDINEWMASQILKFFRQGGESYFYELFHSHRCTKTFPKDLSRM